MGFKVGDLVEVTSNEMTAYVNGRKINYLGWRGRVVQLSEAASWRSNILVRLNGRKKALWLKPDQLKHINPLDLLAEIK